MAEVNPAEISAILKQQLSNHDANISFDETGTVLTIGDGIARVYGLSNVQYGELVEFSNGIEGIVLNLEEDNVGVVLLGASNEIKEGDTVWHRIGDVGRFDSDGANRAPNARGSLRDLPGGVCRGLLHGLCPL